MQVILWKQNYRTSKMQLNGNANINLRGLNKFSDGKPHHNNGFI